MTKIKGQSPKDEEVWTERGELRNPADRSDQPEQFAPDSEPATEDDDTNKRVPLPKQ